MTDEIETDAPPPWERQPWDTNKSFAMFSQHWLPQRPPRKLVVAWRTYIEATTGTPPREDSNRGRKQSVPPYVLRWALARTPQGDPIPEALTWVQRAEAYDSYLAELERQAWIGRQLEVRTAEWEAGKKLTERALAMLATPLFRQVEEDGTLIIEPADWKEADIARALDVASKLMRKAAQMETERVAVVDWRKELEAAGVNAGDIFERLVQEIAASLARGAGPADR